MAIDIVVKVGGGLLAHRGALDTTLAAVAAAAQTRNLLVVPGGGPFADAVRLVDRRLRLTNDAAHWMAILAMEQYAHLIAGRLTGAVLVTQPLEKVVGAAANHGSTPTGSGARIPVLAPYAWLRDADPLPHSWDVTSDSIAAWVAGQVGAGQLVLVKPPGAPENNSVDAYFCRVLPAHVKSTVLPVERIEALETIVIATESR
ncbi:MAG TPA: hypothetical protein VM818_22325 [Vicinamibacterales bacterium]|jgi:aspartokinase-like uncharacterized kinase|nr:hypothetical protein [Vicinamibacterales bacterium]